MVNVASVTQSEVNAVVEGAPSANGARPQRLCSVEGCAGVVGSRGWCDAHYARWRRWGDPTAGRRTGADRFWSKVNKNGPIPEHRPDLGPCWLWTASKSRNGYGHFSVAGRLRPAHAVSYEEEHGPVPEGMELDHLCRTPLCVLSAHLEPVTHRENILRGVSLSAQYARMTHCIHGHAFDLLNTYIDRHGKRRCRACARQYQARRYRARRAG